MEIDNNQSLSNTQKKKEKPSLRERHLEAPDIPDLNDITETKQLN